VIDPKQDRSSPSEAFGCPKCGSTDKTVKNPPCDQYDQAHPFHNPTPGNYGAIISREPGADPLVKEPNER
jgi:hypothetical protein